MIKKQYLELKRLSDDLVYQFDRIIKDNGDIAYKRRDQDLWITYRDNLGWVAWDEDSQSVMGRPWHVLPQDQQRKYPPAGEWVSKKGIKSYVYELCYPKKPLKLQNSPKADTD